MLSSPHGRGMKRGPGRKQGSCEDGLGPKKERDLCDPNPGEVRLSISPVLEPFPLKFPELTASFLSFPLPSETRSEELSDVKALAVPKRKAMGPQQVEPTSSSSFQYKVLISLSLTHLMVTSNKFFKEIALDPPQKKGKEKKNPQH